MNARVSIVRCNSYDSSLVYVAVKKAIDLLGDITNFIRPQSKVLVKPNLLMAKEPEFGITTHPQVIRAVVRILKEIDCKVFIGDGPSVWGGQAENIDEVYEKTQVKMIAEEEDVELVKFDKRHWHRNFPLTSWLDECDYLVSIPKFKTHELTVLTGAIKNLFGLVSDVYKTELHKRYFSRNDFSKVLVDIYQETKPILTIVDGITAIEGDGPATSGKLRKANLLLAGNDCVAIDSILALIMGLKPYDIPTNKEAAQRKLGVSDINTIQILGERLEDVLGKPFQLPTASIREKIPVPIVKTIKNFIRFYPQINHVNCIRCGACIKVCPVRVISIKNKHMHINYAGCISCFCCQEACPAAAIKVKKSLLARVIGL